MQHSIEKIIISSTLDNHKGTAITSIQNGFRDVPAMIGSTYSTVTSILSLQRLGLHLYINLPQSAKNQKTEADFHSSVKSEVYGLFPAETYPYLDITYDVKIYQDTEYHVPCEKLISEIFRGPFEDSETESEMSGECADQPVVELDQTSESDSEAEVWYSSESEADA